MSGKRIEVGLAACLFAAAAACSDATPGSQGRPPVTAGGTNGTLAMVGTARSSRFNLQFKVGGGGAGGRAQSQAFRVSDGTVTR